MAKRSRASDSRNAPARKGRRDAPRNRSSAEAGRPGRRRRWLVPALVLAALGAVVGLGWHTVSLDQRIQAQFEGKRWSLPARVFARPLELYAGQSLTPEELERELGLLHYRQGGDASGHYRREGDTLTLHTRGFPFPEGYEGPRRARVIFRGGRVHALEDPQTGAALALLRLEPALIANIYPRHGEDRLLVRLEDVPPALVQTLLTVEDRRFPHHFGVDPQGIARAALANLRAGRAVQGGSTLTQQLVKNYFLTPERTLVRKFNEAIMALLLEWRYSKAEILEAYLNEVFLGQQGARAIHGVGMASQFYFRERVSELGWPQIALLVGMIRGPSYYNPRAHPERALDRRNRILAMLRDQGQIAPETAQKAMQAPLGVSERVPAGSTPFPAFLELVQARLRQDYREADLREEGLIILTTLDPRVQLAAEEALRTRLRRLESERGLPLGQLEGAVVVTAADSGEVLALVGGRDVRRAGFNRALHARRPVGSVIKPFLYLTALSRPERFTLATPLQDTPLRLKLDDGEVWSPQNSDREYHGAVPLQEALVHSYNVATVRLGLEVGVERFVDRLRRLGLERELEPYPSLLLGAVEMTPLEVNGLYQVLASGGYRLPPRAIRAVLDREGRRLRRYGLSLNRVAEPGPVYLVTAALHQVTRSGTARSLGWRLPEALPVAGKTGTTGDLRDAWFAGFSGDLVGVVWVGRDDNGPTGLSGSSGALPVWADVMARASRQGLAPSRPDGVVWVPVDPATGLRAGEGCDPVRWMPFLNGSVPAERAPCAEPEPPRPSAGAPSWWPG